MCVNVINNNTDGDTYSYINLYIIFLYHIVKEKLFAIRSEKRNKKIRTSRTKVKNKNKGQWYLFAERR